MIPMSQYSDLDFLSPLAPGYAEASPDQALNPPKLQRRRIAGE